MNLFQFVKQRVPILTVAQEYTTLKKAGMYWKGSCPLHSERTGSFTVSPHKEIFYCFGCHNGGDVISFVAQVEQCSPLQAAQLLIERHGLEVPASVSADLAQDKHEHDKKKRYFALCKLVAAWCSENLLANKIAREYLHERGISDAMTAQFDIGYFIGGRSMLKRILAHAGAQNFLAKDLIDAGILVEGKILYSPFEERIIFPITDTLGRHCGFGGRVFRKNDERPKYYNSRENEQFIKGRLLFGLSQAKKAIQKQGRVFLVEGYTDCVAMAQHSHPNTVATLGTACTAEHLKLLSRYAESVCVLYDSDTAGQNAILRLAELCWQSGIDLQVVQLPAGYDPASFLKEHESLQNHIDQMLSPFQFFLHSISTDFTSKGLQERLKLTRRLLAAIAPIRETLARDILLQKAAQQLEIPLESLHAELRSIRQQASSPRSSLPAPGANTPRATASDALSGISGLEKRLFSVILNDTSLLTKNQEMFTVEYFCEPLRTVLQKLQRLQQDTTSVSFGTFFQQLTLNEQTWVSRLLVEHQQEDLAQAFEELLLQFHRNHWRAIVKGVRHKLATASAQDDDQAIREIAIAFEALKKKLYEKGLL